MKHTNLLSAPRTHRAALLLAAALLISIIHTTALSQTKPTGSGDYMLSDLEKAVLEEMNLARTNPGQYVTYLETWRAYFKDKSFKVPGRGSVETQEGVSALEEAIKFLSAASPLPALQLSKGMCQGAKDQSDDQSQSGGVGHEGSDKTFSWERVSRYGEWKKPVSENIAYDDGTAREIVINLIIDDGVPTRGHRRNIFNAQYIVAGVACGKHPLFGGMCVCTFAGGFTDKTSMAAPVNKTTENRTPGSAPVNNQPTKSNTVATPVPRKMD